MALTEESASYTAARRKSFDLEEFMYFTITLDQDGYRARLYGGNHELVWWTEGYGDKASSGHAIELAMQTTAQTPVYDRTNP